MRGHRSPVTDEEELHLSANLSNSSPSNSQPFPKTPKPSANLAASLLSNSGMKPPSRTWKVLLSFLVHSVALIIIIFIPFLYNNLMDLLQFRNTFLLTTTTTPT